MPFPIHQPTTPNPSKYDHTHSLGNNTQHLGLLWILLFTTNPLRDSGRPNQLVAGALSHSKTSASRRFLSLVSLGIPIVSLKAPVSFFFENLP